MADSAADGVLSSEVARMVAGYLTESGCNQTRSTFINEHGDLAEFSLLVTRGILRSVDSDHLDKLVDRVFPGNNLYKSDASIH